MRLLFVVDEYRPKTSANTVCVKNLQQCLIERGVESDIVCYGNTSGLSEDSEYGKVFTVKKSQKKGLIRKIEYLKNFFIWPLRSITRTWDYYRAIKNCDNMNDYDAIIGVLRPLEGVIACALYKKSYILYELDSIGNNSENLYDIRKYIKYRSYNIEQFIYSKALHIFHMKSHTGFYQQKRYAKFVSKSSYLELPGLTKRYCAKPGLNSEMKLDYINIVYTGNLWKNIRSPHYFLELLSKTRDTLETKVKVNFFSQGDCGEYISQAVKIGLAIDNGYVSNSEIPSIMGKADFLLSIGNSFSEDVTSFPSKTIEYMATGRPIIHIHGGKNDAATDYVLRYPNSLVLYPNDKEENNIKKLQGFLVNNLGNRLSYDEVMKIFPMNTPEYTVDQILNIVKL